jgi:hypothetical protein
MGEPGYILCSLKRNLPEPYVESTEGQCSFCNEQVWVAEPRELELRPVCDDCFMRILNELRGTPR